MLRILIILACSLSLYADKLEISADNFNAVKSLNTGTFSGHVKLVKGKDFLNCQKLLLHSTKDGKISQYEAFEVSSFSVNLKGKTYAGRAKNMSYDAINKQYILSGDVAIDEGTRSLRAQKVIIDEAKGDYTLKGENKGPVKLIFDVGNK